MVQISNTSFRPQIFTEKDGNVVEIPVGEARSVDIATDNVNVVAKKNARLIEVGGTAAHAAKTAREAAPSADPPA